MEAKEYIEYFRNLRDNGFQNHRLSYEEVMENNYRKRIVENIINDPGISYNRLRNSTNMGPGQFRWHINVLLDYKIIRKENQRNHVLFFAIDSDAGDFDIILNFPLRETIYNIIEKNLALRQAR
jgi:predicted transcriptional regulator